jgi:hypothetical protein
MPIWDPAEARHLACPPFDLTALLVATCRFNAVALRHVQAIGLRQSGWHAPSSILPRFAAGISATRDKVTRKIIQADDLLAFAAN